MKVIKSKECFKGANADNCTYDEYDFGDKEIDFSTSKILGDYPKQAWCVNEKCKELIYILSGYGKLDFKNKQIEFSAGDAILIDKGELYCWKNCDCTVTMCCTPAWYPEQHKIVKEKLWN